jgi:alcohol dehydrogenase (cytochrome c)
MINPSNEVKQLVVDRPATGRLDPHNLLSIVGAATGLSVLAAITFLTGSIRAQAPQPSDGDWMTYNRTLQGDRYSPLKEISIANVKNLKSIATFDTGEGVAFETGPIVVDGTMYFTTYQTTFAVDAITGQLKWRTSHPVDTPGERSHRGVAYADGMVFRGFNDGHFVAMKITDGSVVWEKVVADPAAGESLPMAPIAWDGKVFVGNAGSEFFSVTGRIYALDTKTGEQIWMFHAVPDSGPAGATWTNKSNTNPPTGAGMWTTFSLDPANGALYAATGNPGPDFALALHPGDNLYANSILALDARSGTLLGFVQPIKHDYHDWDMDAAPAIIRTRGGRELAVAGAKDGLVYGIDRARIREVVHKRPGQQPPNKFGLLGEGELPIQYQTAATRRLNVNAQFSDQQFTRFAPGQGGGMVWNGPAYHPELNLIYTPMVDWASSVKLAPISTLKGQPGQPWLGTHDSNFGKQDPKSQWGGYLTALDADSGKIRWQLHTPTPLIGAVTTTGDGLLFGGDLNGDFHAYDGRTGKLLWTDHVGHAMAGGVVSYQAGGRQYIAVAAGLKSLNWPVTAGTARIVIYRLP